MVTFPDSVASWTMWRIVVLLVWLVEVAVGVWVIADPEGIPVGLALLTLGIPAVIVAIGLIRHGRISLRHALVPVSHSLTLSLIVLGFLTYGVDEPDPVNWPVLGGLVGWVVVAVASGVAVARQACRAEPASGRSVAHYTGWYALFAGGMALIPTVLFAPVGILVGMVSVIPLRAAKRQLDGLGSGRFARRYTFIVAVLVACGLVAGFVPLARRADSAFAFPVFVSACTIWVASLLPPRDHRSA